MKTRLFPLFLVPGGLLRFALGSLLLQVPIRAQSTAVVVSPSCLFPDSLLPPATGTCHFASDLGEAGGTVVVRDLTLSRPNAPVAPPAPGSTSLFNGSCVARGMLSTDGGATFAPFQRPATVALHFTAGAADGEPFDTEMLAMDLSIPGGATGPTVSIRESPTLSSRGRTNVNPSPDGHWMVDSFFDVFTEISLDGGTTWTPDASAHRCSLHSSPPLGGFPSPDLPPATGLHRALAPVDFVDPATGGIARLRHLVVNEVASPRPPPASGSSALVNTGVVVRGELSLDNGATYTAFSTPITAQIEVSNTGLAGAGTFDTEMLALTITGGGLPSGILVRESPTRASLGRATSHLVGSGRYQISSFFDIWTELSVDGGSTWRSAEDGACRLVQEGDRNAHFFPTGCFPLGGDYASGPGERTGFPGTNLVLRNLRRRPGSGVARPLPPAGETGSASFGGYVEYDLSTDAGVTFTRYRDSEPFECFPTTWKFSTVPGDSEASLEVTTPLGSPIRLRESPTLPSRGYHRVRPDTDGFMVDSFFDIFTEVSLDGGTTWTPAAAPLRCDLEPRVEQENIFAGVLFPPRDGSFETRRKAGALTVADMPVVRNMKLHSLSCIGLPIFGFEPTEVVVCGLVTLDFSHDGVNWTPREAEATCTMRVQRVHVVGGDEDTFDTEMLALSFTGGTLPPGFQLRESPTRASTGMTKGSGYNREHSWAKTYQFAADSFFDVFFEISFDGLTWAPADKSMRLHLHSQPPQTFSRSGWMPYVVQYRESDLGFAIPYGDGATALQGVVLSCDSPLLEVTDGFALPPVCGSGTSLVRAMSAPLHAELAIGNAPPVAVTGMATFTLRHDAPPAGCDGSGHDGEFTGLEATLTGGSPPITVKVRESPTLPSPGHTTLRDAPGGFQVDSFFDVFTEISLDGGSTWLPACKPLHLRTAPTSATLIVRTTTDVPVCGPFATTSGSPQSVCADGTCLAEMRLRKPSGQPEEFLPLPPPGANRTVFWEPEAELVFKTDGGTFTRVVCPSVLVCKMDSVETDGTGSSGAIEVSILELSGGGLPSGMRIRESPTLPSRGQARVQPLAGGSFLIDSFFDVFVEVSRDGGTTWNPCDRPLHLESGSMVVAGQSLVANAAPFGVLSPPRESPSRPRRAASGATLHFFDVFVEAAPPIPLPSVVGGTASTTNACDLVVDFSPGGGAPPFPVPLTGTMDTQVTRTATDTGGITGPFDVEMLSLNLTGSATLPGLRLRESPTRPSMGRMLQRPLPGGGWQVDSFFDIWTELSVDGGASWEPLDGPVCLATASGRLTVRDVATSGEISALAFPDTLVGTGATFQVRMENDSDVPLLVRPPVITGPDATSFLATLAETTLPPGAHVVLPVHFSPGTPGVKSGQLEIPSSDPLEPTTMISLGGRAFTPALDDDGDGVTNEQEIHHAGCGFKPTVDDSTLLASLRGDGFYRATDMHALALGRPVLSRDPATGSFHLELGVLKSNTLAGWTPLLNFTPTHDPATGLLDLEIEPDGSGAEFFTVFGRAPAP